MVNLFTEILVYVNIALLLLLFVVLAVGAYLRWRHVCNSYESFENYRNVSPTPTTAIGAAVAAERLRLRRRQFGYDDLGERLIVTGAPASSSYEHQEQQEHQQQQHRLMRRIDNDGDNVYNEEVVYENLDTNRPSRVGGGRDDLDNAPRTPLANITNTFATPNVTIPI